MSLKSGILFSLPSVIIYYLCEVWSEIHLVRRNIVSIRQSVWALKIILRPGIESQLLCKFVLLLVLCLGYVLCHLR